MEFLCPTHRRQFASMPLDQQRERWLMWMEQAATQWEHQRWQQLFSLAGSAFDLASIAHQHQGAMHLELTLSAIFLSTSLRYTGQPDLAADIIGLAIERLEPDDSSGVARDSQSPLSECIATLLEPSKHHRFFTDYLNWASFGTASRVYH